jgi:hypothetical protein
MYARQNAPVKKEAKTTKSSHRNSPAPTPPPPARGSQSSALHIPRFSHPCHSESPRSTRILCCCCPHHSHTPRKEDWKKTSTPASQRISAHTCRIHPWLEVGPEEGSGWGDGVCGARSTGSWGWRDQ